MYTAGIDLGQLIHVLYPLGDLICTTFNSTPSEELTFHLSCCYFAAGAAWDMYRIWRIHIGVWPMYTAGIDLGQLMHVLYPLGDLICTIFNSTPSEELTFHLSCCYLAQSPLQDTAKICTIRPAHEEASGLTAAIGRSPLAWWLYLLPDGVHHGQRAHVPVHSHDS